MAAKGGETEYRDPRADELRARYVAAFGGADLPVPVERIAEDLLGLRVELAPLKDVSGMLIPSERRILLNEWERENEGRLRFTLAHELGHWICHCVGRDAEPVYCRTNDLARESDRAREREANVFAAELLMPREPIASSFATDRDVERLAAKAVVSKLALAWRLYSFGLVTNKPVYE